MSDSDWITQARKALLDFAKVTPRFMPEEAWAKVEAQIGPAPNPNLKGKLFQTGLVAEGHVVKVGHAKSQNPKSKGSEYPIYKSILCKDEDEMVPVSKQLADLQSQVNQRQITLHMALRKAYEMGAHVYLG